MLDVAFPQQLYPDCNIVTKFNIDTIHDHFVFNDLKIDFPTFNLDSLSQLWLQFRSTDTNPLIKGTYPTLSLYNYTKDYSLITGVANPYNLNILLQYDKLVSQYPINNEFTIQAYNNRIVVCNSDGNIIALRDYNTGSLIQNIFIDFDGKYIYTLSLTKDGLKYLVFNNYRDLRRSLVFDYNISTLYKYIVDYNELDRAITVLSVDHKVTRYKLLNNQMQVLYYYTLTNETTGVPLFDYHIPSSVIIPKTMYNLGWYVYNTQVGLSFINLDEYNEQLKAYNVEIEYNGFPTIPTNGTTSICSDIMNNQFDLYISISDGVTYCYRIKINETEDLKCEVIGFTVLEQNFTYFTRISKIRYNLILGVVESNQGFHCSVIKYLPDLNIYDIVESFYSTSLLFFTLKDSLRYYISHDEYDQGSESHYTELKERYITPVVKIYTDVPQITVTDDIAIIKLAVYNPLDEKFVKDYPIQLVIEQNGHFINGSNSIWFYSQDDITQIHFYVEDSNEYVKLEYSFKGSQNAY